MIRIALTAAFSTIIVASVACNTAPTADDGSGSPCDAASDHISACLGTSVSHFDACGEAEAEAAADLLALDCTEIGSPDDPGKADFWSESNLLCGFMLGARGHAEGALCCFDKNCGGDLVCKGYACTAQGEVGASCDRPNHCSGGLRCIDEACAPESELGGACGSNGDCVDGLFCEEDGTCQSPAATGSTCTDNDACEGDLQCIAGTCTSASSEGGPCDVGDTRDCEFSFASRLACVGGTCVPEPGLGEPCEREPALMCGSGNTCWDGVCSPRRAAGEACERMFDCEFGLFCEDGTCGEL